MADHNLFFFRKKKRGLKIVPMSNKEKKIKIRVDPSFLISLSSPTFSRRHTMDTSPHSPIKQLPSTPSRSLSTPFMAAFRHATKSVNQEFDQFYGYVSQVMTPRRSQQQQQQQVKQ